MTTDRDINAQIDKLVRQQNPRVSNASSFTAELKRVRALIAEGENVKAYDALRALYDDAIDSKGGKRVAAQARKLMEDINESRYGKSRKVAIVGTNPTPKFTRDRTVRAPDLPYSVQVWSNNAGDWTNLASFAFDDHAISWAKSYSKKYPGLAVRVVDRL